MCQTGGPRCATHVGAELKKAIAYLSDIQDDPDATKASIKKAQKDISEKLAEYDSTPTGQKKIQKEITGLEKFTLLDQKDKSKLNGLKNRLTKAQQLRAENEEKGEKIRARLKEFEELKAQADEEAANPNFAVQYKNALTQAVMHEGVIHYGPEKNNWGGPGEDYEAQEHFRKCGVMVSNNIEEGYSWKDYDTFTEDAKVGVKADVSCNCGKEMNRKAVLEDASMGSLLSSMLNNAGKK